MSINEEREHARRSIIMRMSNVCYKPTDDDIDNEIDRIRKRDGKMTLTEERERARRSFIEKRVNARYKPTRDDIDEEMALLRKDDARIERWHKERAEEESAKEKRRKDRLRREAWEEANTDSGYCGRSASLIATYNRSGRN